MKLKNIFNQVKSEGFVQDAWTPESVNKPRQAIEKKLPGLASGGQSKDAACETEDKRYKAGDISEKTGLQKQPDGSWKPPKNNSAGSDQKQEEIGKFYTKFEDAQSAYDAGRQTFPEGGYSIYKTPQGYKVIDGSDNKTKSRMDAAGYEKIEDVPEGTKPPKSPKAAAAGGERDISAENRAFHEKADKERAERKARADSKASAARKEAEERKLSGVEMKDFFLAKAYEGASVEMTQRGLEAQGFDLLEANDKVNVYERPEGGRITMQLEGNKIKSAEYQTPAETAKEARSERANPTPAVSGSGANHQEAAEKKGSGSTGSKPAGISESLYKEFKSTIDKNEDLKKDLEKPNILTLEVEGEGTYLGTIAAKRRKELIRENFIREHHEGKKPIKYGLTSQPNNEGTARDLISLYTEDEAPDLKTIFNQVKK